MDSAFNLGKVFGIQFRLHYSWFIIFVLVTVLLSWQVFPHSLPQQPQLTYWVMGLITSLLFFASVLAHELAHSLVGRAHNIPIKSITLFIFGGIAHMTREAESAGDELKMAIAGPLSSVVISGIFYLLWLYFYGLANPLALAALWLAQVNLMLAVFNLIPGFPLDGGRVFRSLLWRSTGNYKRSTRIATQGGRVVGYLFILGGILIAFLYQDWLTGVWLIFIGWFLENAAATAYRQAKWQGALREFTASQVMTSDYSVVPPDITISQLVQRYIFKSPGQCFLVVDEGRLGGMVALPNIKSVPQQNWDITQVKDIVTPLGKLGVAHPDQDVLSIVQQMSESDVNQVPVVSEGRVVGLVTHDSLIRFLHTHPEFGA